MQVLEKNGMKKWYFWYLQGKVGSENPLEKTKEYFNRTDAMADFEKMYF